MTPPWTTREQQASICTGTCLQIKLELMRGLLTEQTWLDICPLCTNHPCDCSEIDPWPDCGGEDWMGQ